MMKSDNNLEGLGQRKWEPSQESAFASEKRQEQDRAISGILNDRLRDFHRTFEREDLAGARFIKKAQEVEMSPGLDLLNSLARKHYMERLENDLQKNFQNLVSKVRNQRHDL